MKKLNLNGIDFSNCKDFVCNLTSSNNLKKVDLSSVIFNNDAEIYTTVFDKDEIILPNDRCSMLKFGKVLRGELRNIEGPKQIKKLTYRGVSIDNFSYYDDLSKFAKDPHGYLENRKKIVEFNKKNMKPIGKSGGCCCTKCDSCKNICRN